MDLLVRSQLWLRHQMEEESWPSGRKICCPREFQDYERILFNILINQLNQKFLKKYLYQLMKSENTIKPLKKSSAIILLYPTTHQQSPDHIYKTLLLKRKSTMSFSNSYVFPGGSCDSSDIKLAKSTNFQQYSKITAIREFLEQSGLLLYPSSKQKYVVGLKLQDKSVQQVCKEMGNFWIGSLGLIQPVLRLMTPQIEKGKRFDCIFHICKINKHIKVLNYSFFKTKLAQLQTFSNEKYVTEFLKCTSLDQTELLYDKNQSDNVLIQTPVNILEAFKQSKIQLAPPQIITFACLVQLCSKLYQKQLSRFSENLVENYFTNIEPIMFNFDIKNRRLRLFGDQDYEHEKLINNEPESDSKNDLHQHFNSSIKSGLVKAQEARKRQINLKQQIKITSDYPEFQSKQLFKFLWLIPQEKPKL